jgi:hypothetical protein
MKTLSIALLLSLSPLASLAYDRCSETRIFSEKTIKKCPYAKDGLTWETATASDIISIEVVRTGENDEEWAIIKTILQDMAQHLPEATFDSDADNAVIIIDRGTASDESWITTLHIVEAYCKDALRDVKHDPETKMITQLNRRRAKTVNAASEFKIL